MLVENTQVMGFEGAFRGMRNPLDSWDKADSVFETESFILGEKDLNLAQRLIAAGPEHCKFLRQIFVSADITAPLYVWKELDQYRIGVTTNSCSTMHTLSKYPITIHSFEIGDYDENLELYNLDSAMPTPLKSYTQDLINGLEKLRKLYIETKDKRYWKELVRWLPESWLQKRTWSGSYANLRTIYHQRKNHKLDEWQVICHWIKNLPYAEELLIKTDFSNLN